MFKTIAIIGVGRMGGGIARNLCHGGFEVTVYDFNPDAAKRCTEGGRRPLQASRPRLQVRN